MNETTVETSGSPAWADVAAASAPEAPKPVKRLVKVRLTETAVADLGRKLAQENADLEAISNERKNVNADLKERADAVKAEIKRLGEAVKAGTEAVLLDVYERRIVETNTVELVRVDTGEVVELAAMTAEQRQLTLDEASNGHADEDDDEESDDDVDADPADASLDGDDPGDGVTFDESWKNATDSAEAISDPQAVLDAAGDGEEKPKKRGRGKKA